MKLVNIFGLDATMSRNDEDVKVAYSTLEQASREPFATLGP